MSFDGTLKFDTAIDQKGFLSGIKGLGSIAAAGMKAVAGAVTAASGAVLALGRQAVEVGGAFESGMAQVAATMGITKDTVQDGVNSFDLLSKAAQDAGANTTFSATEAAGALNYLALAGYSAALAADALPAVLDLAAAGDLDLKYAADLATDAMAALGIEASKDNLTHFGDQMAKTASKANTSVAQLGEAILTVGGTAKSLAGGTDELNAALGVLANRGIKGSEGGTALRNMILSLTAPTDKAAEKLKELGVSVLDAQGNMRPLNEVFRDLDGALSGMADGEKTQVLNDIFNKVDLKSAQAMLAGCAEEFNSLKSAIGDCDGAMSQMAKTMNDTLEGDMKSLQSRAEALGIAVYESINDPLRELAQLGGEYLAQLKDAFDVGRFSGAAKALGSILSDAGAVLGSYLPDIMGIGSKVVSALLDGISQNSPQIIRTVLDMGLNMLSGFGDITVNFLELGGDLLTQLAAGITKRMPRIKRIAREVFRELLTAVQTSLPEMLTAGAEIIAALSEAFLSPEAVTAILDAGLSILTMLADSLSGDLSPLLAAAITLVGTLGAWIGEHALDLVGVGLVLIRAIVDAIIDNMPLLLDAALQIVEGLARGIEDDADETLIALGDIIEAWIRFLLDPEILKKIGETGGKIVRALIPAAVELAGDLLGFAWDLFTEMGKALLQVDWFRLGIQIVEGILSGLLDADMSGYFADLRDSILGGIQGKFIIQSPSKLMHDEVGKYLAMGIGEGFTDEMPDVGQDALTAFREQMPLMQAERSTVPAAAASYITNNYNSVSRETVQEAPAGDPGAGGDIIIPVTIGGQQLDTIVIKAAQIANARSGGVTI